jgi:hypothetical protein
MPLASHGPLGDPERRTAVLNWRTAVVSAATATLTFFGTGIGLVGLDGVLGLVQPGTAKITSPSEPSVPPSFRLGGTRKRIGSKKDIWALSRRHDDGKFYPQDKACTQFDDTFDCGTYYLGNQHGEDVGVGFDLIIVEADVEAKAEFLRAQVAQEPLLKLPPTARILDRIQVVRM